MRHENAVRRWAEEGQHEVTQVGHADALRAAVTALHDSGSATAVLSAAARSAHWHPVVVERVRAQLPSFADELESLGFDVTQLLAPTPTAPDAQRTRPPAGFGCGPATPPLDPALRTRATAPTAAGFGAGPAAPSADPALRVPAPVPAPAPRVGEFGGRPAVEPNDPALRQGTPNPQHTRPADRPRHDVDIPAIPTLSAAAVLNQPSHKPALEFEGTLDGLRGVPIDDLAGIRDDAGVGDKELERLAAAGIGTVYDLMMRIPLRYIDRSEITPMSALRPGMKNVATVGKVLSTKADWGKKYARIEIGAGPYRVTSMQFQQPWMAQRFRRDDLVLMWGDVTDWEGFVQMPGALIAPMRDATAPFVPVYPQSDKYQVSTWTLHRAALDALRRLPALDDPVPDTIRTARALPGRLEALRAVHVPDNAADATSGRDRLAYDELLRMQLAMGVQRNAARQQPAVAHAPTGKLTRPWMESLPWPLTDAQNRVLREIAEDLRSPAPMKRLLQGDVGAGKAQPLYAKVLTPKGFKTMGDMRVGMKVIAANGDVSTVTGVFPQGVRDVYRVYFADGTTADCDDEHLWEVRTSVQRSRGVAGKVKPLREIRGDLKERNGTSKWHVELANTAEFDSGEARPLDPYILGLLLGDGCFKSGRDVRFTTADAELVEAFRNGLPAGTRIAQMRGNNGYDWRITSSVQHPIGPVPTSRDETAVCEAYRNGHSGGSLRRVLRMDHSTLTKILDRNSVTRRAPGTQRRNAVLDALRTLGLAGHGSHSKFVPPAYLNAPTKVRLAVLQGLLDTDGTVNSTHGTNVTILSASKKLAEDVAWLARSLNGRATVRERCKGGGSYWLATLQLPNDVQPFRLSRKASLIRPRTKYAHPAKAITEVERIGTGPVQCISISHPSQLYVTDDFTVTHNTATAIGAMLMAVEGGHQAALMAPIGVLVQQHYEEISETCEQFGLRAVLVPGKNKPKARREALAGLASGEIHIAVGTTGLLSDDVQFKSLGLAVIDEQHRFGVNQRAALLAKGPGGAIADELGATATPIPRTAAMTQFGDVDISILDELPPGRTPIQTRWEPVVPLDAPNHTHWQFVRDQITAGRQAFVVCPLVAEPETKAGQESEAQAAAAMETAAALADGALSGLRIGLVTGRQKPADRAEVMHDFTTGELDVLVATTVIEVGVSVPNATTITILDAGNFGLAQLHQLRGRVGRGKHAGFCVLTGEVSDVGRARMDAMCETTDGFKLANVDLELRGPGALAGTAQAGHRAGLLVADLLADAELMHAARADAQQMLTTDPQLLRRPTLRAEVERALGEDANYLRRS